MSESSQQYRLGMSFKSEGSVYSLWGWWKWAILIVSFFSVFWFCYYDASVGVDLPNGHALVDFVCAAQPYANEPDSKLFNAKFKQKIDEVCKASDLVMKVGIPYGSFLNTALFFFGVVIVIQCIAYAIRAPRFKENIHSSLGDIISLKEDFMNDPSKVKCCSVVAAFIIALVVAVACAHSLFDKTHVELSLMSNVSEKITIPRQKIVSYYEKGCESEGIKDTVDGIRLLSRKPWNFTGSKENPSYIGKFYWSSIVVWCYLCSSIFRNMGGTPQGYHQGMEGVELDNFIPPDEHEESAGEFRDSSDNDTRDMV